MADILLDVVVAAQPGRVFSAVSTPAGLNAWWTNECSGSPAVGQEYSLQFGPQYVWRARVTKHLLDREFELELFDADRDWNGSRVGFLLQPHPSGTLLQFQHLGWPEINAHFRQSGYCWAMYLRCLKRFVESGIIVSYPNRYDG